MVFCIYNIQKKNFRNMACSIMLKYLFMFYPRREKTLKVCKKRVLRKMCRADREKVK